MPYTLSLHRVKLWNVNLMNNFMNRFLVLYTFSSVKTEMLAGINVDVFAISNNIALAHIFGFTVV